MSVLRHPVLHDECAVGMDWPDGMPVSLYCHKLYCCRYSSLCGRTRIFLIFLFRQGFACI